MLLNSILTDTYKDCIIPSFILSDLLIINEPDGINRLQSSGGVMIVNPTESAPLPVTSALITDNLEGNKLYSAIRMYDTPNGVTKTSDKNIVNVDIPITNVNYGNNDMFANGKMFTAYYEYADSYGNGIEYKNSNMIRCSYPYTGSLIINKQEDLDAWQGDLYALSGNLIIDEDGSGLPITDLTRLYNLRYIGGNFTIRNCTLLDTTEQINIRMIKGNILIENNNSLVDLLCLLQITELWGDVTINNNTLLESLLGIRYFNKQYTSTSTLTITNNPLITDGKCIRPMIHPINSFVTWVAGTYNKYSKVKVGTDYFVCKAVSTTETPSSSATDWWQYYEDSLPTGGFSTITISNNGIGGNINSVNDLIEENSCRYILRTRLRSSTAKINTIMTSIKWKGDWNSATTYSASEYVYSPTSGIIYVSRVANNINNDPSVDCAVNFTGSYWQRHYPCCLYNSSSSNIYSTALKHLQFTYSNNCEITVRIPSLALTETYTIPSGTSRAMFDYLPNTMIYGTDFDGDVEIEFTNPWCIQNFKNLELQPLQWSDNMFGLSDVCKYLDTIGIYGQNSAQTRTIDGFLYSQSKCFDDFRYLKNLNYCALSTTVFGWTLSTPQPNTPLYDTIPYWFANNTQLSHYGNDIVSSIGNVNLSRHTRHFDDFINSSTIFQFNNTTFDFDLGIIDPENNLNMKRYFSYNTTQQLQMYELPSFNNTLLKRNMYNISYNLRYPFPNSGNLGLDGITPLRRLPILENCEFLTYLSFSQISNERVDPVIESSYGWDKVKLIQNIVLKSVWGRSNGGINTAMNIGWNKDNGYRFLMNLITFIREQRIKDDCFWNGLVISYTGYGVGIHIFMNQNTWYHDGTPIMFDGVQVSLTDIANMFRDLGVTIIIS